MEKQKRRKKFIPWKPILLGLFLAAVITGAVLFALKFHVKEITVADGFSSPPERILSFVFPDEESRVFYRVAEKVFKGTEHPAFSELRVRFTSPWAVEITGREKAPVMKISGRTEELFFTEQGVRVPGGTETDLPKLDGFFPGEVAFFERPDLTEEKSALFDTAVEIAVYVKALKIPCDFISVSEQGAMLVFQQVHVSLGSSRYLREKLEEVACQYPHYEGLKGTLHMENYDGTNGGKGFTFTTNE